MHSILNPVSKRSFDSNASSSRSVSRTGDLPHGSSRHLSQKEIDGLFEDDNTSAMESSKLDESSDDPTMHLLRNKKKYLSDHNVKEEFKPVSSTPFFIPDKLTIQTAIFEGDEDSYDDDTLQTIVKEVKQVFHYSQISDLFFLLAM